ncbi:cytochrome-c peroxidase [Sphingomonas sp. 28-62-11]|uniref:cytochrome-c peroxidase n=1 Tax=Sphingomonas sp. 28-62-11 TaxID=1970432 RepID=UPI000BC6107A|nr:MAG: hypothetical protein B7Y49_10390 [Sphingomonas sp. 28-62-11]
MTIRVMQWLLPLAALMVVSGCAYRHEGLDRGLDFAQRRFSAMPAMSVPRDNPPSPETIALGRDLFTDKRLSVDGTQSCGTCHQAEFAYGDGVARAMGRSGAPLPRHTPNLINVGYAKALFWDGRAATLEEQALAPIINPEEMGRHPGSAIDGIRDDASYRVRFARAFPRDPTINERNVLRALAAYQRTLVSGQAPFDRWIAGDPTAISPAAQRGFAVFAGPGNCASCHSNALLSDGKFHDIGLPSADRGRGGVTGRRRLDFRFRTPTLREIGRSAPYMHDGSLPTLAAVVDHYSDTVIARGATRPVHLGAQEKRDLVAFLQTLNTDTDTDR